MVSADMTLIFEPLVYVVFNRHNDITLLRVLTKNLIKSYYIQRLQVEIKTINGVNLFIRIIFNNMVLINTYMRISCHSREECNDRCTEFII